LAQGDKETYPEIAPVILAELERLFGCHDGLVGENVGSQRGGGKPEQRDGEEGSGSLCGICILLWGLV
jgi:hypothetical protein